MMHYSRQFIIGSLLALAMVWGEGSAAASQAPGPVMMPRIINGTATRIEDWPWMAGLIDTLQDNAFEGLYCGGTLIAPHWVLTAAHCVFRRSPHMIDVVLGRTQLTSNRGTLHTVERIVMHPRYDNETLDNDIALLALTRPSSQPVIETVDHFETLGAPGELATALGWGNTVTFGERYSDILQKVELPLVPFQDCMWTMMGITENMLCAGYLQGGKDTCQGDSGGPLVLYDRERQAWRQLGITSFGANRCAQIGSYGVYTRLERYKTFISDTLCGGNQKPATPRLTLDQQGRSVTARWTTTTTSRYRLYYAPYPAMTPIDSADMGTRGELSVELPSGAAYYVAVSAYQGNCRSDFSNVEYFIVP